MLQSSCSDQCLNNSILDFGQHNAHKAANSAVTIDSCPVSNSTKCCSTWDLRLIISELPATENKQYSTQHLTLLAKIGKKLKVKWIKPFKKVLKNKVDFEKNNTILVSLLYLNLWVLSTKLEACTTQGSSRPPQDLSLNSKAAIITSSTTTTTTYMGIVYFWISVRYMWY